VLPFSFEFRSGTPIGPQLVYSVKKAVATGQLRPGDRFPSVRALSQELRINPNTAHKAVVALTDEGLLEVLPGIGTVVARAGPASHSQRAALLEDELERLVVEAKRLELDLDDVLQAVRRQWKAIGGR